MNKKEMINKIMDLLDEMSDEYMLEEQYQNASVVLSIQRKIMNIIEEKKEDE